MQPAKLPVAQTADALNAARTEGLSLDSKTVGALPIINHFLERLAIGEVFDRFVPSHKRQKLPHRDTLMILIRNLLIEREPVYEIGEWVALQDRHLVGLDDTPVRSLSDDRFGRSLDALFLADRATMATELVIKMVKTFAVDVTQLHNDSTSITVTGQYKAPAILKGKRSIKLKHGHNKDHRPDLKQLLFSLTVCRDGAVPVHFKTYDGNITDDNTHIATWESVRRIVGTARFTYVADCKLCTRSQMDYINGEGGKFITVMPRSRAEDRSFRQLLRSNRRLDLEWQELLRKRKDDSPTAVEDVYCGLESPSPSVEGYRILWILSSRKRELDAQIRQRKIDKTIVELDNLKQRIGKRVLKTKEQIQSAVLGVLRDNGSEKWFDWQLVTQEAETFKQRGRGRPGKDTHYERQVTTHWTFTAFASETRIQDDATDDGIFPLITNHSAAELSAREVLTKYKYQPFIEKRHEQLKTVFDAAPVYFKLPYRIEALMFIYFIVLIINALIERELRNAMKSRNLTSLPLYPEARLCRSPTTERVISVFRGNRRHTLMHNSKEVKTFFDDLSPLQCTLLDLLGVSKDAYQQ
jgi:transposase